MTRGSPKSGIFNRQNEIVNDRAQAAGTEESEEGADNHIYGKHIRDGP
jgi:hypothetical protein